MRPSCTRGQASAEYLGVVCLVAACLAALAATAGAFPALTDTVAAKLRLALCVVGMDVCDAAHARAKGLEPCVVAADERARRLSGTLLAVTGGDGDTLVVERRSDGRYVVSAGNAPRLGVTAGAPGASLGPVRAGRGASAELGFASGVRWEAPDLATVKRFLGDDLHDPHDAQLRLKLFKGVLPASQVTTYQEGGGAAGGDLSLGAERGQRGGSRSVAAVGVRGTLGRAVRDGTTTWYYRVGVEADGPLADVLPATDGDELVAAWQQSDPPVLSLEATGPVRDGRQTTTEGRLVLRTAADRALARRWLASGGLAGRSLGARIAADGTRERRTYAIDETDEGSFGASVKLGVELSAQRDATRTTRRLVDAQLLGSPVGGRRLDCLGG